MDRLKAALGVGTLRTHVDPSAATDWSNSGGRVAVASLLLVYAALWTVARPYRGLVHDARLYAVQTLAKIQPGIFSDDLFLRFGSQDNFTLFPLLYAPLAGAIGIEQAAALLTLVFSAMWLALGFLVARELVGARLALLSLGALIVIPGWYGAYEVFQVGEMFLSARLPAEVLAMGALLACLRRRHGLCVLLCAGSVMVHPLMAIPMIGLLMLTTVREYAGPGAARLAVLAVVLCGAMATVVMPTEPVEMYAEWLAVLETRSTFLFPALWRLVDWQEQFLVLLTLVLAARTMEATRNRQLAVCAAWVGAAGIVLAVIAAALPEHPTLLRAQPWRWMWVPCMLAILVLPALLNGLWHRGAGTPERAAGVLLASAWLLGSSGGGLVAGAALIVWFAGNRLAPNSRPWVTRGAWVTLVAVLAGVAVTSLQFAGYSFDTNRDPAWIQRTINLLGPTASSLIVVAGCWALATSGRGRSNATALTVLALAALATLGPRAARNWTEAEYSGASHAAFATWRSVIPERAEVLWTGNAIGTWLLLERRSYFSTDQLAGLLYSPRMTGELKLRAAALSPLASPGWWTMAEVGEEARPRDLTVEILSAVCEAPGLDFVVSRHDVGGAVSRVRRLGHEIEVYLYDCRNWRTGRGGTT